VTDWQRKYTLGQRFRTNPHIKNKTVVIRIKLSSKVQIAKYKIEIGTIKFMFNVLGFKLVDDISVLEHHELFLLLF
jgi:hypothetical protein